MKAAIALLFHAAVAAAAATAAQNVHAISYEETLRQLYNSPQSMSRKSYNLVRKIVERQEDDPAKALLSFIPQGATVGQPPFDPKAPKATVEDVQIEKPKLFKDGLRKKIRYGPYRLPGVKEKNTASTLLKVNGMMDAIIPGATKPCSTCTLLMLNADLEYFDGRPANMKTGAWLHHTVVMNQGPNVVDAVCRKSNMESIFESGNEKSPIPLSLGRLPFLKTGYNIKTEDRFVLINEFQNQKEEEQYVWLTVSYEYYDGVQPGFKNTKIIWLSVGPSLCNPSLKNPFGASNLTEIGQPKSRVFEESSIPWTSGLSGRIIGGGGHLHDGGTNLRLWHNQKVMCNAKPFYGRPGQAGLMAGKAGDGASHIRFMGGCASLKPIRVGDTLHLTAMYDFNKHPGVMNNKHELDEVMGIAAVLLATD